MKSELMWYKKPNLTWLRCLIVFVLLLGVVFRFVNLGQKVYWSDETITSLRVSGHTSAELVQQLYDGHAVTVKDFQKYQQPNAETGWAGVVKSLAVEDCQHTPLYYLMERFWMQWFGNSAAAARSLSAVISLLVFPCIYWLCIELFKSPLTGWLAIALIAVSPFYVRYAQEAREYSLWSVTILLSGAALLRALRLKTQLSWGMYAVALALGLYSHLFSVFVAIGHGVYVAANEGWRFSKTVTAYLLASIIALLALSPWLLIVATNLSEVRSTTLYNQNQLPPLELAKDWLHDCSRIFFTWNLGFSIFDLISIPILVLIGYSIFFLCLKTPKSVWLFVLILIGSSGLGLTLPDLLLKQQWSINSRYLTPCYLGIVLACAYCLARKISSVFKKVGQRKLWRFAICALLSVEVLSCTIWSQKDFWWTNSAISVYHPIARIINQSAHPLLIGDADLTYILPLVYLLDPKVTLELVQAPNTPKISDGFSDVFVLNPLLFALPPRSQPLLSRLEDDQHSKVELIQQGRQGDTLAELWKLDFSKNQQKV